MVWVGTDWWFKRGTARHGEARQIKARHGRARQGKARQGKARGKARQEARRHGQGFPNSIRRHPVCRGLRVPVRRVTALNPNWG